VRQSHQVFLATAESPKGPPIIEAGVRDIRDMVWKQKWSEMLVGRWIGGVTTVMSVIICIRRWTFDEFCWGITVQPSKDGDLGDWSKVNMLTRSGMVLWKISESFRQNLPK
jgi:hypothetical protein